MPKNRFDAGEDRASITFVVFPSRSFTARFTGRCHRCRARIERGALCQYLLGEAVHLGCQEAVA